ncbi:MAG: alpha/beta fold hydrolase [Actinophytocola sp.]|nr:alpha/beta fold hydrolase [Actinophytocola sp.]
MWARPGTLGHAGEVTPKNPITAGAELPPLDRTLPPWQGGNEEADGVRLHIRRTDPELSPEGAGTAVYVHGLGGSSTNWTDLGALLAPWGRGLAVDLPGFGYSEPEPEFDYSLASHAGRLGRFIGGLDTGPVHLLGNSMGGAVAALLAASRPELVKTLTLISPAVPDLRPLPSRLSDPRMALAYLPVVGRSVRRELAAITPRQRAEQMIRLCFADPSAFPESRLAELADEHGARRELPWAMAALNRSTADIVRVWLARGSRSIWTALRNVTAPSLVVWGAKDRVVSARKARRTARTLPRGELLMLPRVGHVAQMEQPEAVARAVLELWQAADSGDG